MLDFKYKQTSSIKKLLIKIEALKIVFNQQEIPTQIQKNLRRQSLLKSSLFSAKIEGNPLTLNSINAISKKKAPKNLHKLELFNLQKAYKFISSKKAPKKLTLKFVRQLHMLILKNINYKAGQFRTEPWAIFNQAGIAVYLAPAHFKVPQLTKKLIQTGNASKHHVCVNSAITQFLFEKIHPFADGNGRAGRLLSAFILNKGGFGLKGLISFEQYIDKHRELYYQTLESNKNTTPFVEFFLKSLISQTESLLKKLTNTTKPLPEDFLPPRRSEIVKILKDHPYSSFNFISRRFPAINPKTLHYDIKKLQDQNFIIKIGVTRAATYKAKQKPCATELAKATFDVDSVIAKFL
ncbi:Fic family protein [Patescibacteria group bacterium]|nr:Fic family protein [Patescibacteria group bacterium]